MAIKGNIWLEEKSGLKPGKGRAVLLQEIDETGSISEAARMMAMPYKVARARVKAMNKTSLLPLVSKGSGGKIGRSAHLTAHEIEKLQKFNDVSKAFQSSTTAYPFPTLDNM